MFPVWEFDQAPVPYSKFHIIWLLISLVLVTLSFLLARKPNKKRDNIFVFSICFFLLLTEVYKQAYQYVNHGNKYCWYNFPFQLCSIPMFIGSIAPFIKWDKIKDVLYRYLAFTSLIGGLAILLVPYVCLNKNIIITNHSMLWHGLLVSLGVYLIKSRGYGKHILKETISPAIVLFFVCLTALILNFKLHPIAQADGMGLNLISLSYYQKNDPPILDMIFQAVPYPIYAITVFFFLYLSMPFVTSCTYIIRLIHSKITNKAAQ